jgi:hypothetical protein
VLLVRQYRAPAHLNGDGRIVDAKTVLVLQHLQSTRSTVGPAAIYR